MHHPTKTRTHDQHILSFDMDFNNNNNGLLSRNFHSFETDDEFGKQQQIKNQYSTFIQELQETTQKLMNEVFNAEYKPEIDDIWDGSHQFDDIRKKRQNKIADSDAIDKKSRINYQKYNKGAELVGTQSFKNFITRNNRWSEKKQTFIQKQLVKKQEQEDKHLTLVPKILRGSIEKLQPIYQRALEIHQSKQKKRAFKRIEDRRKEDEQIKGYSFHPEVNQKNKTRTLQQYLQDKKQWEKKKNDSRYIRKLKQDAEKYSECTFVPNLISKQLDGKDLKTKPGQKVQQRLLRSLQKIFKDR